MAVFSNAGAQPLTFNVREFPEVMSLRIRPMIQEDVAAICLLMPQLGYEVSPIELGSRLARLREWPDQEAFVAELNDVVVGLSQVQGVRLLASEGYGEVQALVIDREFRGKGLGSALIKHTVSWCHDRGYSRVRLRSGVHRESAHKFYLAQGFSQAKASTAFELNTKKQ